MGKETFKLSWGNFSPLVRAFRLQLPENSLLITYIKMVLAGGKAKTIVASLLFVTCCAYFLYFRVSFQSDFDHFLQNYSISYRSSEEKRIRSFVFNQNRQLIKEYNEQHPEITLKMNKFGDLSIDEFERLFMAPIDDTETPQYEVIPSSLAGTKAVDWTEKGFIEGRTQRAYTSSTPIAVVQSLEYYAGQRLSVQQLVDCYAWHSTFAEYYDYVAAFGGLMSEEDYPTIGYPADCAADPSKLAFSLKGRTDLPYGNQEALQQAVATSPVVVGFDSKSVLMQFYSEGIVESDCEHYINTAGLLVGFGEEDGVEYWRVLTSFGSDWGEAGFVRIRRGGSAPGVCGVATSMVYPKL